MTAVVVADAGPLIGLGRVGRLPLLRLLYGALLIPPRVLEELDVGSGRPGATAVAQALAEGWLQVRSIGDPSGLSRLSGLVDAGEAEALVLAEEVVLRFLLIDDRRGRAVARRRGLTVVGTGGVLLAAKKKGLQEAVGLVVAELAATGYRLSPELRARLLALAGES
ncbi:MAG: DUF3368 domain-containing protein [Deltaproteobacteria bacterium]|nr:DUF3368 domain-containing protein [Deltaproteobacteria bacterium]